MSPSKEQFSEAIRLWTEWNARINVVSRKDTDMLYEHHVLHSLAIAKALKFKPGTSVLDFGTGGGFPGIPLAILFPEVSFKLIDGTGKKILVANSIAESIGLKNVYAEQKRGEDEKGKYDFVVSRAVMPLQELVKIVRKNISKNDRNSLPNGIMVLKGGKLDEEIKNYRKLVEIDEISTWFKTPWFKEKYVIYLPLV